MSSAGAAEQIWQTQQLPEQYSAAEGRAHAQITSTLFVEPMCYGLPDQSKFASAAPAVVPCFTGRVCI